jgi:tRNA 2-selenouridine synthase
VIVPVAEFLKLRAQLPAVDVRSENEFAEGQIPGSVNIPILNNQERIAVGTDYKQKGQLEAIKTGFRLVGPRIIDIVTEAENLAAGKELLVYCWRGGMRSTNFCQFLSMARIKTHQLEGGYKSYRNYSAELLSAPYKFNVLAGSTGSGKTEILNALQKRGEQIIDLEKIANHKGSVFGGLMMPPQPTTEQFQNYLTENILQLDPSKPIWIEDESITIGKVVLPSIFWHRMNESQMVELKVSKDIRIKRLVNEYGNADREEFLKAMTAITKKLGGQHFQAAKEKLLENDMASAIDILLTYYDKVYGLGLLKKENRVKLKAEWNGESADQLAAQLIDQSAFLSNAQN